MQAVGEIVNLTVLSRLKQLCLPIPALSILIPTWGAPKLFSKSTFSAKSSVLCDNAKSQESKAGNISTLSVLKAAVFRNIDNEKAFCVQMFEGLVVYFHSLVLLM